MAKLFEIDSRALAALRIFLGSFALLDLYFRLRMGLDFYTDDCNPSCAIDPAQTPHHALPHQILFFRGCLWFQKCVFTCHVLVAICFTVGLFRWRWWGLLLWIVTTCMHGRQEIFTDGSDSYFRNMLAWTACVPVFDHYTIHARDSVPNGPVRSWATVGLTLQVAIVYWAVMLRRWYMCPEWFDGRALYIALSASFATKAASRFAIALPPSVLTIASLGASIAETLPPLVFIVVPASFTRVRTLAVVSLVALHAGISLLMHIPQFQLLSCGVLVVFLPPAVFPACKVLRQEEKSKQEPLAPLVAETASNTQETNFKAHPSDQQLRSRKQSNKPQKQQQQQQQQQAQQHQTKQTQQQPTAAKNKNCFTHTSPQPRLIPLLMVLYSVMHFGSAALRWYPMPDDGDVGEIFRFRQTWQMYCPLQQHFDFWLVTVRDVAKQETYNAFTSLGSNHHWSAVAKDDTSLADIRSYPLQPSASDTFPSWRYERMFFFRPTDHQLKWFARHVCWSFARSQKHTGTDPSVWAEQTVVRFEGWTATTKAVEPVLRWNNGRPTWRRDVEWYRGAARYTEPTKVVDLRLRCSEVFAYTARKR